MRYVLGEAAREEAVCEGAVCEEAVREEAAGAGSGGRRRYRTAITRTDTVHGNVIALAIMIGTSQTISPYTSQQATPVVKIAYIGSERPPVDFVRQVVQTCGRNAAVVSVAAARPRSVIGSMRCALEMATRRGGARRRM